MRDDQFFFFFLYNQGVKHFCDKHGLFLSQDLPFYTAGSGPNWGGMEVTFESGHDNQNESFKRTVKVSNSSSAQVDSLSKEGNIKISLSSIIYSNIDIGSDFMSLLDKFEHI